MTTYIEYIEKCNVLVGSVCILTTFCHFNVDLRWYRRDIAADSVGLISIIISVQRNLKCEEVLSYLCQRRAINTVHSPQVWTMMSVFGGFDEHTQEDIWQCCWSTLKSELALVLWVWLMPLHKSCSASVRRPRELRRRTHLGIQVNKNNKAWQRGERKD